MSAGSRAEITGSRLIVMASGCIHLLPLLVAIALMRNRGNTQGAIG